jgi:hypothetical protein
MKTSSTRFNIVILFLGLFLPLIASASSGDKYERFVAPTSKQINTLKVFLEGRGIDFDYVRRNIGFVNFVNDPKDADVHIIMTQTGTGGGGTNYLLNFYSKAIAQVGDFSLNCISMPNDTHDIVRECITRTLKLGLMPYINETSTAEYLSIEYNHDEKRELADTITTNDPWKNWVYRLNANGSFGMEQSKYSYNYSLNLRGDKVSEKIKIRNSVNYNKWFSQVESDGEIYRNNSKWMQASSSAVYSLAERWSAGLFINIYQSSYTNTEFSTSLKPAIEYNIFPWEDSDKRRFTIGYNAGPEYKDYYELTIFGKEMENLWGQNLRVNYELVQTWGEIETSLSASSYFHDFAKNSISLESDFSFRITRGLSLNFQFRAVNVHNQLYLAAGEASLEDILMGTQKLPSTFELSGGMGVRIQFGSIYNNVVNNRL